MKLCVNCRHAVSQGDRDAIDQCPPVAGTGKPSASSKATGKGK